MYPLQLSGYRHREIYENGHVNANITRARHRHLPNTGHVLPDLVRVCALELGQFCRALDLEEDFITGGGYDLGEGE